MDFCGGQRGISIELVWEHDRFAEATDLAAVGADQSALQLSLEEVNDDAIVPLFISVPAFLCEQSEIFCITTVFPIRLLDVWLFLDPVQILVQSVEEERNQFLRVLLAIASE